MEWQNLPFLFPYGPENTFWFPITFSSMYRSNFSPFDNCSFSSRLLSPGETPSDVLVLTSPFDLRVEGSDSEERSATSSTSPFSSGADDGRSKNFLCAAGALMVHDKSTVAMKIRLWSSEPTKYYINEPTFCPHGTNRKHSAKTEIVVAARVATSFVTAVLSGRWRHASEDVPAPFVHWEVLLHDHSWDHPLG